MSAKLLVQFIERCTLPFFNDDFLKSLLIMFGIMKSITWYHLAIFFG